MITSFEAKLDFLSVHHVGNKAQDEYYHLSERPVEIEDETLSNLLQQYFLGPFAKENEVYRFFHSSENLNLNELYHFSSQIFDHPEQFHEVSGLITKHLFETSNHPKIKAGELYVALFRDIQVDGQLTHALGIFKSETKETYLKVYPSGNGFDLSYEKDGINIQKLDKGCLICNTDRGEGYQVVAIDQTNRTDAAYWKDDFLKLRIRNDSYNKTANTLKLCRDFITEKIDEQFEISRTDKIDLLNRSIKYFKENESFDTESYANEVIGNEKAIESFKNFSNAYSEEFSAGLDEPFDISTAAVKKQSKVFKSVLKLDKNFHIYVHGNKEMIERGFDDEKNLNFYKVYFREEQ